MRRVLIRGLMSGVFLGSQSIFSGEEKAPIAPNYIKWARDRLFFVSRRYFVRNWALLGPFYFEPAEYGPDKISSVIDKKFVENEANLEPVEGKEVKDGRKWLLYKSTGVQPEVIDLGAFYGDIDYCNAYAVAYLYSDQDYKDCVLLCGSDDFHTSLGQWQTRSYI